MASLAEFFDERLLHGHAWATSEEIRSALGMKPRAFATALTRSIKKHQLATPHHGFYLILRPEDREAGAPDPLQWIDPLMHHLGLDYRISLLRAAEFHGSSHQAAMVFQVITPGVMRSFEIGRHRIEFIHQTSAKFARTNRPEHLQRWKNPAGYAQVAGLELTLLDCSRYFHKAAGINGVAQIVRDLGAQAGARKLAKVAEAVEISVVQRLGFLMEHFGHHRQAMALAPLVASAKTYIRLNPALTPLFSSTAIAEDRNARWKLILNEPLEIDF